jgi:hypothetical protein
MNFPQIGSRIASLASPPGPVDWCLSPLRSGVFLGANRGRTYRPATLWTRYRALEDG